MEKYHVLGLEDLLLLKVPTTLSNLQIQLITHLSRYQWHFLHRTKKLLKFVWKHTNTMNTENNLKEERTRTGKPIMLFKGKNPSKIHTITGETEFPKQS